MNANAILAAAIAAAGAYLLGCLNGAVLISKYVLHDDVRNHGSGNAGLTNFYRTYGPKASAGVLACDVLKAVAAVLFAEAVFAVSLREPLLGKYWGALFCLLGHMFPCMFRFKGGKGILSGGVAALLIDWRVALIVWGAFLICFLLTRYVSLGSLAAAVLFPIATRIFFTDARIFAISILCGALVVWQHRENIARLVRGEERRFRFHRDRMRKEDL
ncbi:MAG: glycerol-3-phosphate 1-O-acyltransferase PlsY [Oscillibacter sp.]|nr:glycerol-3-phosphate 1-O-acyltransferase PlsY [Oscillibacter sp.]